VSNYINGLERRSENREDWNRRLEEAKLELKAANADLAALISKGSEYAYDFAIRVQRAQDRLAVSERLASAKEPHLDALDWLVKKFGNWAGATSKAFVQPVMVFLDGIPGKDELASNILSACSRAGIRVASFAIYDMPQERRVQLYAFLDTFRTSTPLAVSDFVLTLNGETPIAHDLAVEFRVLSEPGTWETRAKPNVDKFNLEKLRHFYMAAANALGSARDVHRSAFATRLTSALTAFEAADKGDVMPSLDPAEGEQQNRLRETALELRGKAVCLDEQFTPEIKSEFDDAPIEYVGKSNVESALSLVSE
jgi:hypothetical protein